MELSFRRHKYATASTTTHSATCIDSTTRAAGQSKPPTLQSERTSQQSPIYESNLLIEYASMLVYRAMRQAI